MVATLVFSAEVEAADTGKLKRRVPHDGVLNRVSMFFPASADHLMDVRLNLIRGNKTTQVVPTDQDVFVALDDDSVSLQEHIIVVEGDQIEAEWQNNTGGTLRVPVIATIEP